MKKAIGLIMFTVCGLSVFAQEREKIVPSGNVVSRDVNVQAFDAIEAKGLYELVLSQGDKESVRIEADDNLQSLFSVVNTSGKLVIDMPGLRNKNIQFDEKNDKHEMRLKVYVTFRKLNSLDIAVIGNVRSVTPIKCEEVKITSKNVGNVNLQLTAEKVTVENKGVGNIELTGKAKEAVVTNNGVGQFDGETFVVQTMDIDNSGVGKANVNVEKNLKVKQSFLGKVTNAGSAKTHVMDGVMM